MANHPPDFDQVIREYQESIRTRREAKNVVHLMMSSEEAASHLLDRLTGDYLGAAIEAHRVLTAIDNEEEVTPSCQNFSAVV